MSEMEGNRWYLNFKHKAAVFFLTAEFGKHWLRFRKESNRWRSRLDMTYNDIGVGNKREDILDYRGALGLGAAYVEVFLEHGAEKIVILDIAEKPGKELSEKLNQTYTSTVVFIKCDISKENEVEAAFEQSLKILGRIDVIINNAGVMNDSPHIWRTASDINWQGVVSFTMKGISHMRKDEGGAGGTIINISSAATFVFFPMLSIYAGSKAAVLHFGRCLASPDFNTDTGIRILTMCPGPTDTPLLSNIYNKFFDTKVSPKCFDNSPEIRTQSVQSVVNAVVKMYREGSAGSIWLSIKDKPGRDVTEIVNAAWRPMEELVLTNEIKDGSALHTNK